MRAMSETPGAAGGHPGGQGVPWFARVAIAIDKVPGSSLPASAECVVSTPGVKHGGYPHTIAADRASVVNKLGLFQDKGQTKSSETVGKLGGAIGRLRLK